MNCAGLSREFLETELFGHEKGAFTGAVSSKPGLLEVAHRGVVFLDEIGDLDPQVQPKLLKVLEEKRFRRLGEVRDRQVDVQLIAATHQNLTELVQERRFRGDLYFRISTIPLRVPPLRERPEDIPVLARGFLEGFAQRPRPPGRCACPRRPSGRSATTPGPATCASCATCSSAPCSSPAERTCSSPTTCASTGPASVPVLAASRAATASTTHT